jgi:ubiquitin-like protein Pup
MATQDHKQRGGQERPNEEIDKIPQESIKKDGIDEDVDSILDEIDEVLETNAEDFVKSFIQKGGQ